MQTTPPLTAKLKSLHCVSRGQFPIKMVSLLCGLAPNDDFKITPNLYALPGPINMTNLIRQHPKFPPTASPPRQT